jgi:Flp pilus assembly protein TadD
VDSLGWVLYRLRRYDDAVEHLERAVELRPEDPVINDHLGDALWQVGRRVEARFQWRRALSLEPEAQMIPVIKNKLEVGLVPDDSDDQHFGQDS